MELPQCDMDASDSFVWDWCFGFAVLKVGFLAHGLTPVGILTSVFPPALPGGTDYSLQEGYVSIAHQGAYLFHNHSPPL